jgi:hypothetical protein
VEASHADRLGRTRTRTRHATPGSSREWRYLSPGTLRECTTTGSIDRLDGPRALKGQAHRFG